jgi:DNA-binding transcriptional regulator YiaG
MSKRVEFFLRGQERLAEPYHYLASGLDDIYLLNGVTVEETPYGPMVTIKDLNGLHRAIGLHIVEKAEPMTGAEFRFLRKQLELTQAQLGKRLRVSDQTIANYEKENTASLGPADPLMRGFYLLSILPEETRIEVLRDITEKLAKEQSAKVPDLPRRKIVSRWKECARKAAA